MVNRIAAIPTGLSWADQGTSIRFDVLSFAFALAFHVPLYFMKFDTTKKAVDVTKKERLVSVDLLDEIPKPDVAPPPPPVVEKESKIMQKLKALMQSKPAPPPPAPVKKPEPQNIETGPKPIELQAKMKELPPVAPKLESKSGFQTTVDAKLVKEQKIAMDTAKPGIAPISAQRVGTLEDRAAAKTNKGNFQVKASESLGSIGGGKGDLAGVEAPTIQIATARKESVESFSAALPQKTDKGKAGGFSAPSLAEPSMGLRDKIIARDAQVGMIGGTSSRAGVPHGTGSGPLDSTGGGVGTKRDAGSFKGDIPGGVGGGAGTGSAIKATPQLVPIQAKPKEKKSMFTITGPLKDRKIEQQVIPSYPAWAQAKGIEAAVVLQFTVLPDGTVKNTIVVQRTSGYPQLDEEAIKALRKWKFVALPDDENREEVGFITFNFSLS